MRKLFYCGLALSGFCLTSCSMNQTGYHSESFFAMDTYMKFTAYSEDAEEAVDLAKDKVCELEKKWSVTDKGSEIYKINHSNGKSVFVSSETEQLIEFSLDISEMTDGALDCTIYPVLSEWGFTKNGSYNVPSDSRLAELLDFTGFEKVTVNDQDVVLPENMQIDLGAVGKGSAGDYAAEIMKECGIESALLDLGGNIHTIGTKPDGTDWKLGLRSPFDKSSFAMIEVSDCAVVTSGGYERCFTGEDGEVYWHILDPETGKPAHSGLASVTVIGKEGRLCDALSTALFVMGLDKAERLWTEYGYDFDMVLVINEKKVFITDGIEDKFSLNEMYDNMSVEVIRR